MINDEELEQELNEDTAAETDVEVEQPETETEGDKVSEELAAVKDQLVRTMAEYDLSLIHISETTRRRGI